MERIAELLTDKKLPLLNDVRDESADYVRLVLEPKSRTVDAEQLMEHLFRQSDLEVRIPLNLNVLDSGRIPRVMNLKEVCQAFLAHRQDVLIRKSKHRLLEIARRTEILDGYLIVYLNLDEVIRIIREEDEPKVRLMKVFSLTDTQADAILNMRLRSLRRLEEMEIKSEHKALKEEESSLKALLANEDLRWQMIGADITALKKQFGPKSALGRRRTTLADAPTLMLAPDETLIEREPVTVICSEKGWIRVMKGHQLDPQKVTYKEGDKARFVIEAETPDKLLLFATNGRFYTLPIDKLPGGRGHGEPVRLMIDLSNDQDIVSLFVHRPERKLLVAASDGRGFVVPEAEVLAQTRTGRQVLNVQGGVEAQAVVIAEGDTVAVVGGNRKLLLFPLADLPEMTRGRGVILQKYKEGGLSDVKVITLKSGLSWSYGGKMRQETQLSEWIGQRGQAGRIAPKGFNSRNRFS